LNSFCLSASEVHLEKCKLCAVAWHGFAF